MGREEFVSVRPAILILMFVGFPAFVVSTSRPVQGQIATSATSERDLILVEQIVAERATALVRERRIASERESLLLEQNAARDQKLRETEAGANATAATLERVRKERYQLAKRQKQLFAELASRDREVAAEIAAFREHVTGIAHSGADERAALERFAKGDREGGLTKLESLARAEIRARRQAEKIADAAKLRLILPRFDGQFC